MGGATNSQGQATAVDQINNFVSNLPSQGYSGKDGTANLAADAYGVGVSGLYAGMAVAAGEIGSLPGPIGWTGTAVNVVVGVATSGGAASPTCAVVGVVAGAAAGVVAGAAATPTGPVGQFLAGAFVGVGAQKIATAACQTALGYINGEEPATPASTQTASAQSLQDTVATSNLPQSPAISGPPQGTSSSLAAQVVQFRPSPDYTGADGAYTVQAGQTLTSIAASNGITLSQLTESNPQIVDPNSIRSGQIIQLPSNASGYTSEPQTSTTPSIPDNTAQTNSLASTLDLAAGTNVVVVTENSGRIAVLSTTTGQATLIANDGSISTESLAAYNQQAQTTYNSYLENGYINSSSQAAYADYQNGLFGTVSADGQTGTVQTSAGLISKDSSGDITAVSNGGQLYQYDQANSNNLFAGDTGADGALLADVQTKTANGTLVDDSKGYTANDAVQYETVLDTTSTGAVTDTINGSGVVVGISNASVTLVDGSSATVSGNNNLISVGSNDNLTINGTLNKDTVSGTGSTVQDNGSKDYTAIQGNNDSATVTGINSVADSAGTGDQITLTGSNDGAGVFGSGSSATDTGVGGYVALIGNNDTGSASGNGTNTWSEGSSDYLALNGNNETSTVYGDNSVTDSAGTGDKTTLAGTNDGAGVFGSGSSATDTGAGGYVALIGNSDTGSVSGSGTNTWSEGSSDYLVLNGNNETSTVYGDNSVTDSTGTGDKTTLDGANDGAGVFGSGSSAADTGAGGYVALIGNSDTGSVSGSGTNTWSEGSSDYLALNGNNETSTVYGNNSVTDSTGSGDKTTLDGTSDGAGVFGSGSSATDSGAGGYVALIGNNDTGSASGNGTNTWSEGSSDYLALNGSNETSTVYGNNSVTDSSGSGDKTTLDGANDGAGVFGSGSSATDSGAGGYIALLGNNDEGYASGVGTNTWSTGSGDSFGADAVDVVSSPAPVSAPTPAPAPPTEVAPEPTPAPAPEPIAGGYYGYDGFAGSQSTINRALGSNISSIAQYDLAHGDTAGAAAAQVGFKEAQAAQQSAGVLAQAPAVLEAAKWDSNVITWSVGDAAAGTATSFSGNMDIAEEAAVQQAFATWAQASGLTFVEVADSSQADIRVGLSEFDTANTGVVGYTTFHAAGGAMQAGAIVRVEDPTQDAMISGADGQLTYSGTQAEFEQVLLHEIGHALGLASNGDAQSVMNYELTSSNLTLDSTDIAGIQALYGTSSGPLSSSQVTTASQLVQAMASFAPPAPGAQTGLPTAANQSATSFLLTAAH
ncbi:beta strand repeat-containing protein [Ralstonia pseudosolanacearum]